ncbi:MAG TPA: SRPBCC domain-containing protein [Clostridia bacterium]|nr:SRPBCC domain-containing protein [Clostridia bacterium]
MRKVIIRLALVLLMFALVYGIWWFSPYHQVRSFLASTEINAPADRVWQLLTDFNSYPYWNPYMRVEGQARQGEKVRITLGQDSNAVSYTARIRVVQANRQMRWTRRVVLPGILDREQRFELEALDATHTRLTQSERFSGILVVPMWKNIALVDNARGYREMNNALKARAETQD